MKPHEKLIAVKRESAIRRGELREISTEPRVFAPGTATYPIKAPDPSTRRLVEGFLARQKKQG